MFKNPQAVLSLLSLSFLSMTTGGASRVRYDGNVFFARVLWAADDVERWARRRRYRCVTTQGNRVDPSGASCFIMVVEFDF
jgi:hypothetical protein